MSKGRPALAAGHPQLLLIAHLSSFIAHRSSLITHRSLYHSPVHTSVSPHHDSHRAAGVLLHPTSLPGRYGIGDLGDETIAFLDWAASAGMKLWQGLPLNPPGYGYSPYGCLSLFAGNPLLISPQRLLQEDLLGPEDVIDVPAMPSDHVDFEKAAAFKFALLRKSWSRFTSRGSSDLDPFVNAPEQEWLADYALYMALKERSGGGPWWEWDRALVEWEPSAIAQARQELAEEIRFWQYLQWLFFRQWS